MFGTLRYALALAVLLFHLGRFPLIGEYAVFCFFVLSGFLMTAILHRHYGYGGRGRARFLLNRLLRLFPSYYFALAVSLLVILLCGDAAVIAYKPEMAIPGTRGAWAANLLMAFPAFTPASFRPRLIPPAWALSVEWLYYALIALGLSKTGRRAAIWLAVSAIANLAVYLAEPTSPLLYGALAAGSLPFAVGACAFLYQEPLRRALARWRIGILTLLAGQGAAFVLPFAGKRLFHLFLDPVGNWLNVALSGLLVVALHDRRARTPERLRLWDARLGDFSYPIYLLHFPLGALASLLVAGRPIRDMSPQGLQILAVALLFTHAVAAVPVFAIDPRVARWRDRIRPAAPRARHTPIDRR